MADPIPHLERLLLADDDLVAATVAWTTIEHAGEQGPDLARWADGLWYDPARWMLAAGLKAVQSGPLAERLLLLGFITTAGEAWGPVLQLARSKAAKRLKAGR